MPDRIYKEDKFVGWRCSCGKIYPSIYDCDNCERREHK